MTRGSDRPKRALDITIAVALSVLTLPISAATALVIHYHAGSTVPFGRILRRPRVLSCEAVHHDEQRRGTCDVDPALRTWCGVIRED